MTIDIVNKTLLPSRIMNNQPIKMTCKLRHAGKPDAPEKETVWQWLCLIPIGFFIAYVILGN